MSTEPLAPRPTPLNGTLHRGHAPRRIVLAMIAASTLVASCRKARVADRPVPPKSVGKTLVSATSTFREGMSIHIPREIAIEPKFGQGAAEAFASSLGRDVLAADVLRSVSPSVAAMQEAGVVRVNDSPISEQYNVDAPADMGMRASASSLLSTPSYQHARRYWRHYLRVEPADPSAIEWITAPGDNEADETTTSARVVRTPGWRAVVAHRDVVAVDSMYWEGESLSVAYRWRWVPSVIGAPFVSDTLAADHLATGATDMLVLSSAEHRATLSFVKTEDGGWAARATPVATTTATP